MRRALVLTVCLAGCFPDSSYQCDVDIDCSGGEVCARTHECLLAGDVRALRVRWEILGQPDTTTGCPAIGLASLTILFSAPDSTSVSFTPVPCDIGQYSIDKLPTRFDRVELSGYDVSGGYHAGTATIGAEPEYLISL